MSKPWNSAVKDISTQSRQSKFPCGGFTLIEVLLAMAILGLCVTGLLVSVSRCLSVASKARLYDTARNLVARVDLENPLLLEEEIEEGTESGDFDNDPEGYNWEREIELVETGGDVDSLFEDQEDLYKITTRVLWSQHGRQQKEEVVTYLYRPNEGEDSF